MSDQRIRMTGKKSRKAYSEALRLVTIKTEEGEQLQFLTNHMTLAASTIADVYNDRWQIEVFFKLIKQNLRIKTFVGTSANAVWIQIWTALIAMLLVQFLKLKARFGWSFSNLVYFLRLNLLVYRDLWDWLNNPFTVPPEPIDSVSSQLELGLC
jgi:IS4 transposase